MKKVTLVAVILLSPGFLFASSRKLVQVGTDNLPKFNSIVTEAGYISSATCAPSTIESVNISSGPAFLYMISVSSKGAGGPIVQVFDAKRTTDTARIIEQNINGLTERDHLFNVELSSGLAVSNQGAIPACLRIIYAER